MVLLDRRLTMLDSAHNMTLERKVLLEKGYIVSYTCCSSLESQLIIVSSFNNIKTYLHCLWCILPIAGLRRKMLTSAGRKVQKTSEREPLLQHLQTIPSNHGTPIPWRAPPVPLGHPIDHPPCLHPHIRYSIPQPSQAQPLQQQPRPTHPRIHVHRCPPSQGQLPPPSHRCHRNQKGHDRHLRH